MAKDLWAVRTDRCLTGCRLTGGKQLIVQGHADPAKHFLLFSVCVQLKQEKSKKTLDLKHSCSQIQVNSSIQLSDLQNTAAKPLSVSRCAKKSRRSRNIFELDGRSKPVCKSTEWCIHQEHKLFNAPFTTSQSGVITQVYFLKWLLRLESTNTSFWSKTGKWESPKTHLYLSVTAPPACLFLL